MSDVPVVTSADSVRDQRRAAAALAAAGAARRVTGSSSPRRRRRRCSPSVLGALRTGIVPVVLDPGLPAAERAALAEDAEPALDLADDPAQLLGDAEADLADVPLARPMHYTSGTTGRRKGVWSGVLAEDDARAARRRGDRALGLRAGRPAPRALPAAPQRAAAVRDPHAARGRRGAAARPLRHRPRGRRDLHGLRPTTTFCVPTHLQRLIAHGDRLVLVPPPRARRRARAPQPLKRAVLEALPDGSVWEFYGSTEAQFTVCSPEDWLAHPGSVGRARPGRRLETDERGQLWCAVPRWARFEYWRAPEKTAAAWRGDLVTVGDLGRVDDDGMVWLDGRREDLVISGGVNVYPAEVEAVLDAHPDVVESAVFGVPDEEWGQRVVAAYVGAGRPGRPGGLGPRAARRGQAAQEPAPARRPAPDLHGQGAPAGPARRCSA